VIEKKKRKKCTKGLQKHFLNEKKNASPSEPAGEFDGE
jgi:hypothetical protein